MLDKIVSIKNVGRFRNYKARGNVRLERNTIVLGGNGHGKTTLCAILRSLQTNDSSHILGRRAVDAAGRATVKLIAGTEVRKFNGRSWKSHYPSLAVFDGEFVAQNVHSGDVVDLGHKRNLYRVIIGEAGVRLAREEFDVSKRSREMTREITAVEDRISPFVPTGMPLKTFIGLRADPKIAKRIKKQKRNLRAHQRAQEVLERAPLSELGLPSLPKRLRELLARTVDDIANDAEARLQRHVAIHRMGRDGRNWIAKGVQYATGEDCPFCGQDIEELPLIGAYRSVFSEQYTDLKASIRTFQSKIEQHFGERAIGSLTRLSERNQAAAEFWRRYCDIEPDDFTLPVDTPEAIRKLRRAARKLLGRKSRSPLEAIQMNRTTFKSANAAFRRARSEAKALALRITAANEKINQVKSRARAADVRGAEAKLSRLKAVKRRHTTPVKKLCAKLSRKTGEKQEMDRKKSQLREELNNYTLHAMKPFQERINKFLAYFRTGFRIKNTRHAYPGGQPASSYQLVINNRAVDLGDGRTPNMIPSFKNTLSSGDRSALALAFFLSSIEGAPDLSDKTVVFDDPFNSQDSFRRSRTVNTINRFSRRCAQVITLSHDPHFLKEIWVKASAAERRSLMLFDQRSLGTTILEEDINQQCETTTAADLRELEAFAHYNEGDPTDIKRKLRPVLEHHLLAAHSTSFTSTSLTLGTMTDMIRAGGLSHPAASLLESLVEINEYSRTSHHAGDPLSTISTRIDPDELLPYVEDTLQIVGGSQP